MKVVLGLERGMSHTPAPRIPHRTKLLRWVREQERAKTDTATKGCGDRRYMSHFTSFVAPEQNMCMYVRAYVCVCVRARACACVCVCLCVAHVRRCTLFTRAIMCTWRRGCILCFCANEF